MTLIATDRRLLLVHVDAKGHPMLYANQIPYTAIRRVEPGAFGISVAVETGSQTLKLRGLQRKVQDWLAEIVDRNPNAQEGLEPLCPSCLQAQRSTSGECTRCGAGFKSARTAAIRSLIFPGLGDIYLGQTLIGAAAEIVTATVWMMLGARESTAPAPAGLTGPERRIPAKRTIPADDGEARRRS